MPARLWPIAGLLVLVAISASGPGCARPRNPWVYAEPPAVSVQAISSATWGLCLAYDLTGDDRYLEPLRNVLTWMDGVPEDQRGWLWYDPATNVPVVAYYNEMLPVTDPKAIEEIIPRLNAHYGTKYPWQADRIRRRQRARIPVPGLPAWIWRTVSLAETVQRKDELVPGRLIRLFFGEEDFILHPRDTYLWRR